MREFQPSQMIVQQKGQDESLTSDSSHLEAAFVSLRSSTGSSARRCSLQPSSCRITWSQPHLQAQSISLLPHPMQQEPPLHAAVVI